MTKVQKRGNYSRGGIIQGGILIKKIRYIELLIKKIRYIEFTFSTLSKTQKQISVCIVSIRFNFYSHTF